MTIKKEATRKDGTLKKIFCYIKKYNLFLILSLVFAAISVALTLYVPLLVGHAIDCIVGLDDVDFDRIIG
ncbi:MAG: ABC transporter ATP-binding protein, partial [Lachnospiraceae bacterium]|nr:ABC transporter ATP-binding protein [Lachnospiraceae bacterium]